MLDDSPCSLSKGLLFTMEKTMKCCHYKGDQRALWQPDTWSPLWLWLPFVPVFHIWHIHTTKKQLMQEQQWTWSSVLACSDMGNKQTIFTAQQLDAYQVGVTTFSYWKKILSSFSLTDAANPIITIYQSSVNKAECTKEALTNFLCLKWGFIVMLCLLLDSAEVAQTFPDSNCWHNILSPKLVMKNKFTLHAKISYTKYMIIIKYMKHWYRLKYCLQGNALVIISQWYSNIVLTFCRIRT